MIHDGFRACGTDPNFTMGTPGALHEHQRRTKQLSKSCAAQGSEQRCAQGVYLKVWPTCVLRWKSDTALALPPAKPSAVLTVGRPKGPDGPCHSRTPFRGAGAPGKGTPRGAGPTCGPRRRRDTTAALPLAMPCAVVGVGRPREPGGPPHCRAPFARAPNTRNNAPCRSCGPRAHGYTEQRCATGGYTLRYGPHAD